MDSIQVQKTSSTIRFDSKAKILELLQENRIMSVATMRPDGWPQATMVGYVHDDLTLYFVVARISQKLANIAHDGRISIALGHYAPNRLRGISMAARAAEVTDLAEIERLNAMVLERYPEQCMFSPRETSVAVLRAMPVVVSVIDLARAPGEPELVEIGHETTVHHIENTATGSLGPSDGGNRVGRSGRVFVEYTHPRPDDYRPGAPL